MTRRLAVAGLALVAALALAGCGDTGAAGPGTVTVTGPTITADPTLSQAEFDALVARQSKPFLQASRSFRRCDATAYVAGGPCLAQAALLTSTAEDLLVDLRAVDRPEGYDALVRGLATLTRSGARVQEQCAADDGQPCDRAFARLRADEQTVLWELDTD